MASPKKQPASLRERLESSLQDHLMMTSNSVFRILRWSPRILALPSVMIYPTSACNYDCVMCDSAKSCKKIPKINMEMTMLEGLLRDLSRFRPRARIHFSGYGEPLVYPRIQEAMRLCREWKLHYSMTTNAYLLPRYAEEIVDSQCAALNISIHGDEERHEQVSRIPGSYRKIIDGLKFLDEVKRTTKTHRPIAAVNCVITNENVQYLSQSLLSFEDLPISGVTFQHLAFLESHLRDDSGFALTDEKKIESLTSFMEEVENHRSRLRIYFFPRLRKEDIHRYYTHRGGDFHRSCVMPWLNIVVYPNGDVKQCRQLLGNLRQRPLREIMNNEKAIAFRNRVRKGQFWSQECFRCCHRHYY